VFLTLSDAVSNFHQAFEPVEALKPGDAWHALLTNAGRPMARSWTPHTADDYVLFETSRNRDGQLIVLLERRIAQYVDDGYDSTAILGCYLTMQDDDKWREALTDRWWAEGHVRNKIEASPLFAVFCRAVITDVGLTPPGATQ
jgi:hypothetical protein